ncbi:MAG: hypothetical protein ACUVQM_05405 [Candidatus Hadarchaeaceae archaeon]
MSLALAQEQPLRPWLASMGGSIHALVRENYFKNQTTLLRKSGKTKLSEEEVAEIKNVVEQMKEVIMLR